jgi:hypothetical protein
MRKKVHLPLNLNKMKKAIFTLAAGLTCCAFSTFKVQAQPVSNMLLLNPLPGIHNFTPVASKFVKAKALREFRKDFPGVNDEQWSEADNGWLLAHFNTPEIRSTAYYDNHGNWQYTFNYYGEDQLPKDVRALVKSTYYDYTISGVQEIRLQEKIVYIVQLQDAKTWKKVRVMDGDMDLMEDFNKF